MSGDRTTVRLYSAFVGLYPRSFRDEYGADMVQLVRDQCDDEPAWRVFGRAAIDLAITIPTQQLGAHMDRNPTHLTPLMYTAIAAAGVLLAIAGGSNIAMLIVGACIAITSGTMAAIAWRRAGPMQGTTTGSGWWKFVAAGPCIVAAVVIAANLGVEAWELMMASLFFAFVLTFVGLALGLARLVNRRPPTLPT